MDRSWFSASGHSMLVSAMTKRTPLCRTAGAMFHPLRSSAPAEAVWLPETDLLFSRLVLLCIFGHILYDHVYCTLQWLFTSVWTLKYVTIVPLPRKSRL